VARVRNRTERDNEDLVRLYLEDIGRHQLLTKDDEARLAQDIEAGKAARETLDTVDKGLTRTEKRDLQRLVRKGEAAQRQFVQSNLRLVVSIAKRYQASGMPLLDLVQEGNLGLIHAVEKFDWRKGFKFSTYATWWIRQACQRAVANQSKTIRIPVHVDERRRKLSRARQRFEAATGREPTLEELATAAGVELVHAQEALEAVEANISLNRPVGDDGDAELADLLADRDSVDPMDEADLTMRDLGIRKAVEILPERERRVIELRFGFEGESMSLEAIGKELGITRERVRQLEASAFQKLAGELEGLVEVDGDALADSA
jgi:RNA polymerase sigma factor (sigma-70 family)